LTPIRSLITLFGEWAAPSALHAPVTRLHFIDLQADAATPFLLTLSAERVET